LEDIALSIKLYSKHGSVDQASFKRAVHVIAGVELTQLQVLPCSHILYTHSLTTLQCIQLDVIFHVFDVDGDGKLNQEEVLSVLQQRADRGLSHPRDTGIARLGECVVGCFKKEWERK